MPALERANGQIPRQERLALREIEGAIRLEAPGIQADGDIVGEGIGAGEVEVDQARNL